MTRTFITTLALVLLIGSQGYAQQAPAGPTPAQPRVGANFVDADGDGICDLYQARGGQRPGRGRGYGPGDGTGNQGNGPKDGTGYGAMRGGGNGTGNCTGTGPAGQGPRRRGGRW